MTRKLSFPNSLSLSLDKYVPCMSVNTKWIIIHNDMNLYTLLINQCCRLNIIYLYVYSLDITSLHGIINVFMKNSNQNRNTYTWFCFYGENNFSIMISEKFLVVWKELGISQKCVESPWKAVKSSTTSTSIPDSSIGPIFLQFLAFIRSLYFNHSLHLLEPYILDRNMWG